MSTVRGQATSRSLAGDVVAFEQRARVPLRALLAAALLSLAVGVGLYEGFAAQHSSPAPAGRFRAASHLRSHPSSHTQGLSSLPLTAQGPISEALGASNPAYRVSGFGSGYAAKSPTQHFRMQFARSGVSLSSGATRLGLSLDAIGYGDSLSALAEVAPRVKANRVSFERSGLSEWYANGPVGLEQGFTIARAPSGHPAGALTLSMALSGNAHASLGSAGQSITFSRSGRPVLRYGGLTATDAKGRALHSWLELHSGRIVLRVDAAGARYPLRIDPFIQQGEKLTGSGEKGEEGAFAYSVAISAEGSTALIGGPSDNGDVGAAWVFTRSGTTWTQQALLTGKEEAGAGEFGRSVALSTASTGEYALVGGPGDDEGTGAAWVFLRESGKTTWTQQAKLTGKEETGSGDFGYSVSIGDEGTYALIGGPANKENTGAAWVFLRESGKTTWAQQALLTAKEETGAAEFGASVAVASKEGNYALVGGPQNKEGTGAAWVFLRTTTTWAQQALLTAKEETGAGEFGRSVAISATGEYSLIGGPQNNTNVGAAWVFFRESGKTTWAQQALLTAKEETGAGEFGASVAIASKEGNYALIGGPANKEGIGAAWVFLRTTTTWAQQAILTGTGENGASSFGNSVAISSEGTNALVGGVKDSKEIGAAWVFTRESGKTTWAQQGEKLTGKEEVFEPGSSGKGQFAYSVAISAEGSTALIGGPSDNGDVGAAWVFTRSGTTWTQQALLTGKEEAGAGEFGRSVALSTASTGEYALVGGPQNKEGAGAAWVFLRETGKTTWTQQAMLTGKEETGSGDFGYSVSIGDEGTYALIGGPANKENTGAAWVFLRESGKTTWAQQALLTAKEETGAAEFGASVAVASKEGNYALVGGPQNKEGTGAAWVFLRTTTTWAQQALLTAKEETGAGEFGRSVAISATGEYSLIGGPQNNTNVGAAWVFFRESGKTTWAQQALLTAKEETGAGEFGASVAIASKEGNYALIGGPANKEGIGAAWVFLRTTTTWAQQAILTGGGENGLGMFGGSFGNSVAISSEGTNALVGGVKDSKEIGAAWVFTRESGKTTWAQQGEKLTGKEETGEGELIAGRGDFGFSVALSGEGSTALIGGAGYQGGVGAAWVFTRSGTTWTQQGGKLTGSGEVGSGEFGASVALSSNGEYALIGGDRDNEGAGAAWVFLRESGKTTWTQQGAKLTAKAGEEGGTGEFAKSVAISSEGNTALMGAPGEGVGFTQRYGAAYVFTRTGTSWSQQGAKLQGPSGENGSGEFGVSAALSSNGSTALIGAPGDSTSAGGAWVYAREGTTWAQQGEKLTGKEETGEGQFGFSVALASNGNTALIGGPGDSTNVGAAWVLTRSGTTFTQLGTKLTGKEEVGAGEFGESVALSSNGDTALIGGPDDNNELGAAWVFTHAGASFTQLGAKLTGGGESGEGQFGNSVALSGEGNTALIGGLADTRDVGAAWVFANSSPTVETKTASEIAQTTATLSASVNPDGAEVSECKIEYASTEYYEAHSKTYGSSAPCTPAKPGGSGTTAVAVTAAAGPLTANTTYHYRIFAKNAAGTGEGADATFKTLPNPPTLVSEAPSPLAQTTATLKGTVNPNASEVTECKFEYATTEYYEAHSKTYLSNANCTPAKPGGSGTTAAAISAAVGSLTANTTYHFRIIAKNEGGKSETTDATFKTLPNPPTLVSEAPSPLAQTTATLKGTVNPNGGEVTECTFEYATTEYYEAHSKTYGSNAPCTPTKPGGSGTTPAAISAAVTGLTPNTTYHFKIVAKNAGGTGETTDATFKTLAAPPTPVSEPPSPLAQTTATLKGTVNPNASEVTECKFEYATTEYYEAHSKTYGSNAPCTPTKPGGSGTTPAAISAAVTGLTPNTTYHFKIVAKNAGGTGETTDATFKTLAAPPTPVSEPPSPLAQTTATLKGTVNPNASEVTECKFEYATTEYYEAHSKTYGSNAPCTPTKPGGSGTTPAAISAAVTGLTPNTTYHFRIIAKNEGGNGETTDATFKTLPNPPTLVSEPPSPLAQTTATLKGTVNPNGGEITECTFEYATTEYYEAHSKTYGSNAPCTPTKPGGSGTTPAAISAAVGSLTANTTYHFRITAKNEGGKSETTDATFKTLPNAPTVVTGAATNVTLTSATLNGTVNPNGGEITECKFEYGETKAYGQSIPCTPAKPGSGNSPVAVSASVTGLNTNVIYHFRLSASNGLGSTGTDQKFITDPPTVVTEPASAVTLSSATLNATVNPNGEELSECAFEYGTTIAYGSSVPCSTVPEGESPEPVLAHLTGLVANTTYHFRISATNRSGPSKGADETFVTSSLTVTTTSLSAGEVGSPYSQTLTASGGTTPYVWSLQSGSLPAGLHLAEGGAITGTPTVAGSSSFTVKVTDSSTPIAFTATASLSIIVTEPTYTASISSYEAEAKEFKFSSPNAVALDSSGNIWVADTSADRVVEFNSNHQYLRQFGSEGSGEAQFKGIGGIATNAAGDVYVVDTGNDRVEEFSPEGKAIGTLGSIGTGEGQFIAPSAIAVDASGDVWVVNSYGLHQVEEFSSAGKYKAGFGTAGSGQGPLLSPTGIAFSGGNLYATEDGFERVVELSTSGQVLGSFGSIGAGNGQFYKPSGIAADPVTGNLYITELGSLHARFVTSPASFVFEATNNRVQELSPQGGFIAAFGSTGSGPGQFSAPRGVAVSLAGGLFIADTANKRVQEWVQAP